MEIELTVFLLQTLLAMDMHLLRIPLEDRRPLRKTLLIFAVVLLAVFGVLTLAITKSVNGGTPKRPDLTERVAERYPEYVVPLSRNLTELLESFLVSLSRLTLKQESTNFLNHEKLEDKSVMDSPLKEELNVDRLNMWEEKVLKVGSISPYLAAVVPALKQSPNVSDCKCNCLKAGTDYQAFLFPIYLCAGLIGIAILLQLVGLLCTNSKYFRNNKWSLSSKSNGPDTDNWKRIFSYASDFYVSHLDGKCLYQSICSATKIYFEKYFNLLTGLLIKAWNMFVAWLNGSIVFLVLIVRIVMNNDLFLEISDWLNPPAEPLSPELVKFMKLQNEKNLAILATVKAILQICQKGQRGRKKKTKSSRVSLNILTPYRQLSGESGGAKYSDVTLDEHNIANNAKRSRTLPDRFPRSVLIESESDFSSRSGATTVNGIGGDDTHKTSLSGSPTSCCSSWQKRIHTEREDPKKLAGCSNTQGKKILSRDQTYNEAYLKTLWVEPQSLVKSELPKHKTRFEPKDQKECTVKSKQSVCTKSLQSVSDALWPYQKSSQSSTPIRKGNKEPDVKIYNRCSNDVDARFEIINEKQFVEPAQLYHPQEDVPSQKSSFSKTSKVGTTTPSFSNKFEKPLIKCDGSVLCNSVSAFAQHYKPLKKVDINSNFAPESSSIIQSDTTSMSSGCSSDHFNYVPHKTLSSKQRLASCVGNDQFYQPFSFNSSETSGDGSTNSMPPNHVLSKKINSPRISDDNRTLYEGTAPTICQTLDSASDTQVTSSSSERESVGMVLPRLLCGGGRLSSGDDSCSIQSGLSDGIHFERPPVAFTRGCVIKTHLPATDNVSSGTISRSANRSSGFGARCSYSTDNTFGYDKQRTTHSLSSRSEVGLVNPSAGNMRLTSGTSSLRSLPMYPGRSPPDYNTKINPNMLWDESSSGISISVKKQALLSNICIPTTKKDFGDKDSSTSFSSIGSPLLSVKYKELHGPHTGQMDLGPSRGDHLSYRKYDSIDTSL